MARRSRWNAETNSKAKHWTVDEARRVLGAWERSGLSMAAFCRKRGIRAKRLYWWRNRLAEWAGELASEGAASDQLIEAIVVPSSSASAATAAVVLHLRCGDKIEVVSPKHVEASWLACVARCINASAKESAR